VHWCNVSHILRVKKYVSESRTMHTRILIYCYECSSATSPTSYTSRTIHIKCILMSRTLHTRFLIYCYECSSATSPSSYTSSTIHVSYELCTSVTSNICSSHELCIFKFLYIVMSALVHHLPNPMCQVLYTSVTKYLYPSRAMYPHITSYIYSNSFIKCICATSPASCASGTISQ